MLMRLGERGRGDRQAAEIASHLVLAGPGDAARATAFAWRAGEGRPPDRRVRRCGTLVRPGDPVPGSRRWRGRAAVRAPVGVRRSAPRGWRSQRSRAAWRFTRLAALAREVALPTFLARATLSLSSGSAGFEVDMFDREQIDLLWEAHAALPGEEAVLRTLVHGGPSLDHAHDDGPRGATRRVGSGGDHPRPGRSRRPSDRSGARCTLRCAGGSRPCVGSAAVCRRDVAAATTLGDWSLELLARRFLLVANLELGDLDAADDQALAFRLRAARARHPLYEWYGPLWKATPRTARRAVLRGGRGQRRSGRDRRTSGQHERRPALRHPALVPARRDR